MKKIANAVTSIGNGDFKTMLRRAGHRATPGRIALLESLRAAGKPVSIAEMRTRMSQNINEATAYRTLHALEEKGIVREINLRHGHADYELADTLHHHHLVCTRCGDVGDVVLPSDLAAQEAVIKRTTGFQILNHVLEFFGTCKKCREKT